jgi:hypothetical protein
MNMKKLSVFLALAAFISLLSCTKDELAPVNSAANLNIDLRNDDPCITSKTVDLMAGQHLYVGSVTVSFDVSHVYVKFASSGDWYMGMTHLYVGDCAAIPTNRGGNPRIGNFPHKKSHSPIVQEFTYKISRSTLGECFCIAAHAEVHLQNDSGEVIQSETAWGAGERFNDNNWAMFFDFCIEDCEPPTDCDEQLRTQTIGGWGSTPNGQNPGAYLHQNFSVAFPDGLTVGCAEGFTIHFTTAQAITDFLPDGGTAGALSQSFVNPHPDDLANVLASQMIALTLSVKFDQEFPDFGPSSSFQLHQMVIAGGPFMGWTVEQVMMEGNKALGGCPTDYSFSDLNEAISKINENYVDGVVNNNYLGCMALSPSDE